MKTFKEVEAFIRKAMEKGCAVSTTEAWYYCVYNGNTLIQFSLFDDSIVINYANTNNRYQWEASDSTSIKLTDKEKAARTILHCDVKEYEANVVNNVLDNFFNSKENNRTKTIDDLEFDDENNIE